MKQLIDEYMNFPYQMVMIPDEDEGGTVVLFPDLPGCISCGETLESAIENAQDAKNAWLTAAIENGISIRKPDSLNV